MNLTSDCDGIGHVLVAFIALSRFFQQYPTIQCRVCWEVFFYKKCCELCGVSYWSKNILSNILLMRSKYVIK